MTGTVRLITGEVDTPQVNNALRQLQAQIDDVARNVGTASAQPVNIQDLARQVSALINVGSSPSGSIGSLTFGVPPVPIGTMLSEGSSLSPARADHVHTVGNTAYGCLTAINAQTITSGVSTKILFNVADSFDTDSMHDPAVNPERITIQHAGYYIFGGYVVWTANAVGRRSIDIQFNGGGSHIALHNEMAVTDAGVTTSEGCSGIYQMAAGQYAELFVVQSSGGNLDTSLVTFWAFALG